MSGCAFGDDGTLKDAKDIEWFDDADDDVPIPPSRTLTASSSASSVTSLDNFFISHPSAKKVGGERHSTRIRKPSKRTTDPDNAEAAGSAMEDVVSGQKRKADISSVSRRVTRKVIESDSGSERASDRGNGLASSDAEPDGDDTEDNSDDEEDNARADAKYNRLKSLGDNDREVLTLVCQCISYSHTCSDGHQAFKT
jgi:hypothetical protein